MSDTSPGGAGDSPSVSGTPPRAAASTSSHGPTRAAPRPAGLGPSVPPPPGPVLVPAGLGLPVGYYTPAVNSGARRGAVLPTRRRFSLLVVAGMAGLGALVGAAIGAGAVAAADVGHHGELLVGTGGVERGTIGEHGGSDDVEH